MITGMYSVQLLVGLGVLATLIAFHYRGVFIGGLYFVFNALYATEIRYFILGNQKFYTADSSAMSVLSLIVIPLAVAMWSRVIWPLCYFLLLVFDPIYTLARDGAGLFDCSSCDTSMMACALVPFALSQKLTRINAAIIFFNIMVMLYFKSSTPIFVLAISGVTYGLFFGRRFLTIGLSASLVGLAYLIFPAQLFRLTGRAEPWIDFMTWWWENANIWKGTGLGTFQWIGSLIHVSQGRTENVFIWMHNDWLQILFETGIIGLALALAIFLLGLVQARRNAAIFCGLVGFAACMMAQFPLHFVLSQTMGMALLFDAHRSQGSAPRSRDYASDLIQSARDFLRYMRRTVFPDHFRTLRALVSSERARSKRQVLDYRAPEGVL